jgi:acetoin utilization deacetylase AcuC-like enzyme
MCSFTKLEPTRILKIPIPRWRSITTISRKRDRRVFEFAKAQRIPIAWVLAGGYTKDVSKIVRVHLNTFDAWRDVYGG